MKQMATLLKLHAMHKNPSYSVADTSQIIVKISVIYYLANYEERTL